ALGVLHPRLSPDGSTIACSFQGAIWVLPRQGGTMKCLTHGEGLDTEPAWSPNGKLIAFIRSPGQGAGELHLIRAADGSPVAVPKHGQVRGPFNCQRLEF